MTIRRELINELLNGYEQPQDILGEGGLLKDLTKAVIERCLETELATHLGYSKHARKGNASGNTRNGHSQKTLTSKESRDMWTSKYYGTDKAPSSLSWSKRGKRAWTASMTKAWRSMRVA